MSTSEEVRKKISEALKGRVFSVEHRQKIAAANRRRKLSEETKDKIRQRKLGVKMKTPPHNKTVATLTNGILTKNCPHCKIDKAMSEYGVNNHNHDGIMHVCKECHATRRREYYANNEGYRTRQNLLATTRHREVKVEAIRYKGAECSKCGLGFQEGLNDSLFEFHHLDPSSKDFAVTEARAKTLDQIKSELDKCILVCANCHRLIHQEEWRKNGRT